VHGDVQAGALLLLQLVGGLAADGRRQVGPQDAGEGQNTGPALLTGRDTGTE